MTDKLYTIAEAAKKLGIAPTTLSAWIREKKIPATRLVKQWRIKEEDLLQALKKPAVHRLNGHWVYGSFKTDDPGKMLSYLLEHKIDTAPFIFMLYLNSLSLEKKVELSNDCQVRNGQGWYTVLDENKVAHHDQVFLNENGKVRMMVDGQPLKPRMKSASAIYNLA